MPEIQGTRVGRNITQYDYTNQAWIVDGLYQDCGGSDRDPWEVKCGCHGCKHAGEPVMDGAELQPR